MLMKNQKLDSVDVICCSFPNSMIKRSVILIKFCLIPNQNKHPSNEIDKLTSLQVHNTHYK